MQKLHSQNLMAKFKALNHFANKHLVNIIFSILIAFLSIQPSLAETTHLPEDIEVEMLTNLFSERSEINDAVEVKLLEPINLPNDRLFIPVNSVVSGKVVEVQESARGLRKGKVKVIFERIVFPNGYTLYADGVLMGTNKPSSRKNQREMPQNNYQPPLSVSDTKDGEVKGKMSFRDKFLAVGKVGVGALMGGPIGAAAAAGTLIFDKGGKVRIKEGDRVFIHLEGVGIISQELNVRGEISNPPLTAPQPRY